MRQRLYTSFRFDSDWVKLSEIDLHYADLSYELGLIVSGLGSGGVGRYVGLTVHVPMRPFVLEQCYPYAAVLFALHPQLGDMGIGSIAYDGTDPDNGRNLTRESMQEHYKEILDRPLIEYGEREQLLLELLQKTAAHGK